MHPNSKKASILIPLGLVGLGLIPVLAGSVRLIDISLGTQLIAHKPIGLTMPISFILHIIGASLFVLLGAFQFAPALRRGRWHKLAGRLLLPVGAIGALSGVWMTLTLQPDPTNGPLLVPMRLLFGMAWSIFLAMGAIKIYQRDFATHARWMTRAYAVAIGSGLQSLILIPWVVLFGVPEGLLSDLAFAIGWIGALLFAEFRLRAPRSPSPTLKFS